MLYHLLVPLAESYSALNVFRYITFRTAAATLTALFLALVAGPAVIRRLQALRVGQPIREIGPDHQGKAGTPTMGGLLILLALVVSVLLWADLTNRAIWTVLGLTLGWNARGAAFTTSWWSPSANGWNAAEVQPGLAVGGTLALVLLFGKAMVGPIFSQSGWNNVTFAGGEVRDPGRNLPAALFKGTTIVVTLYILANLAYVVTLPLDGIQQASQNRVGTALMEAIFGGPGTIIMAVAIMISTFGCNNGLILVGARVSYAMACDRLFFTRAGRVNRRHVPAVALGVQGIWASLLTLPRSVSTDAATGAVTYGNVYTQLLEFLIPADLVFFALLVGAVIVMRRKAPGAERPYRTIGYPVTPVLYIVVAALLIVDLAYLAPATAGIGYLLVLSGIPVYLLWRWWGARHPLPDEVAESSATA